MRPCWHAPCEWVACLARLQALWGRVCVSSRCVDVQLLTQWGPDLHGGPLSAAAVQITNTGNPDSLKTGRENAKPMSPESYPCFGKGCCEPSSSDWSAGALSFQREPTTEQGQGGRLAEGMGEVSVQSATLLAWGCIQPRAIPIISKSASSRSVPFPLAPRLVHRGLCSPYLSPTAAASLINEQGEQTLMIQSSWV